jgi:hypothetical protein
MFLALFRDAIAACELPRIVNENGAKATLKGGVNDA